MKQFSGIMDIKQVAKYLCIAEITAYRLVEKGKIPGKKVGAQWRFLKEDLDRYLRERV